MHSFATLLKLTRGDQVAVVFPSADLPELFPWVQEFGLRRLRDVLGLNPLEYPTTRRMQAPLEARAQDVMHAFANPANKAVCAPSGGSDQLQLLKYLDPAVFVANPKPFFGFSDNTHLHTFLWNLGIPSYYGGAVMTQLAMQQQLHDCTAQSCNCCVVQEWRGRSVRVGYLHRRSTGVGRPHQSGPGTPTSSSTKLQAVSEHRITLLRRQALEK